MFGHITKRLFENLNTRSFQSSGAHKYVSLIYGEISEDATFRFLSAAQPTPVVFSRIQDRLVDVALERSVSFPPLGMMPSWDTIDRSTTPDAGLGFKERYQLNEWQIMGAGDILLIFMDGLSEHRRRRRGLFSKRPGGLAPAREGSTRPRHLRHVAGRHPRVRPADRRRELRGHQARLAVHATHVVHVEGSGNHGGCDPIPRLLEKLPTERASSRETTPKLRQLIVTLAQEGWTYARTAAALGSGSGPVRNGSDGPGRRGP